MIKLDSINSFWRIIAVFVFFVFTVMAVFYSLAAYGMYCPLNYILAALSCVPIFWFCIAIDDERAKKSPASEGRYQFDDRKFEKKAA